MKEERINEAMDHLDGDLLDAYFLRREARGKEAAARQGARNRRLFSIMAAALCCVLIISAILCLPEPVNYSAMQATQIIGTEPMNGIAIKKIGKDTVQVDISLSPITPSYSAFSVLENGNILVARAKEVLPDIYMPFEESIRGHKSYRMTRMEITDPLTGGYTGDFYYALPADRFCDLTAYDSLILIVYPSDCGNMYINQSTKEVVSLSPVFSVAGAEYLQVIPFKNGVLDISPWHSTGWTHAYTTVHAYFNQTDSAIVHYGISYDEAIRNIKELVIRPREEKMPFAPLLPSFTSPEAKEALAYIAPFENGIFNTVQYGKCLRAVRYINGCPTNETVTIEIEDGKERVTYGKKFTEEDLSSLPDVGAYIEDLDLASLSPNMDTDLEGLWFGNCRAYGFYHKTDTGAEAVVRVMWHYYLGNTQYPTKRYTDDIYIRLTGDGEEILTRTEARALLGEDCPFLLQTEPIMDMIYPLDGNGATEYPF